MSKSDGTKEKAGIVEMLSYGGAHFASSIFMAFSSYYMMAFYTDVALIPPAATAVLLLALRLYAAPNDQLVGFFMNRMNFPQGKYRPYFKWCALPFAVSLAALGFMPEITVTGKIVYAAIILFLCELFWSTLNLATLSLLPYIAKDDVGRTKFVSFFNAGAILAYIIVGTFMLPLINLLAGEDKRTGFSVIMALFAVIAAPLILNAYFRLRERHFVQQKNKPTVRAMFGAITRNKPILLFMTGYCLFMMADAFKNQTLYYYMTYNMNRPDLLPVIIMVGLVTPLAAQPVIPRLLTFAKKETLIIGGLFVSAFVCLLMLIMESRFATLMAFSLLYGAFTAVAANLVFTVLASFSDEIHENQGMNMSDILSATLSLSSKIGVAIAGGAAPLTLAIAGYSAQASAQPASALFGIKMLLFLCPAAGMALAGIAMLLFYSRRNAKASLNPPK